MIGDYILQSPIGEGSFSCVKMAIHTTTHTKVAVKIIPQVNFSDPEHISRFHREVKIIKDLDHPLIAEFFEVLEDDKNFYIIMEFVENGNMLEFVNNGGALTEDMARHFFSQLISVLEYLHNDKKIAHRDLKAENVLLDRNKNIRLIDFGLSNMFSPDNPFLKTACGSPAYASPEMIKGNQYTVASDYWSAGILLYAMAFGELPFEDDNTQRLLQKIVYSEPSYPLYASPQLRDLLNRMLTKDPDHRITLKKIKEHPWFSQSIYSEINEKISKTQKWRVSAMNALDDPVDREIVSKLTEFGYDCQSLVSSILRGEINHLTAVYRMLKKDKITEMMKEICFGAPRAMMIHEPVAVPRYRTAHPPPLPMRGTDGISPRCAKNRGNYKTNYKCGNNIEGQNDEIGLGDGGNNNEGKDDDQTIGLTEKAVYEKLANSANLKRRLPPIPQPTLLQSVASSRKSVTKPIVALQRRKKRASSMHESQRHSIGPL